MDIVQQTTKIVLDYELVEQGLVKTHITQKLEIGRATLYRWLNGIQEAGSLEAFVDNTWPLRKVPRRRKRLMD